VLRLSASANQREVQARYAEARVEAQLDGDDQNDLLDELLRAHSELLDPRSRWIHETTWFYEPPESIFEGKIADENDVLQNYQRNALLPGESGIRGKHDLSNWLILMASHSGGNQKEFALRALVSWNELLANPEYFRMLGSESSEELPTIGQLWDVSVLKQFSVVAQDEANRGNTDIVVAFIEAFQESGRTQEEVSALTNDALQQLRATVQESRELAQANTVSMNSRTITPVNWVKIITEPALKLKSVLSAIDGSETESSSVIVDCSATLDGAAYDIRAAAVDWFNDNNSAQVAMMLLENAMDVVATEFRWEALSEDHGSIRYTNALNDMVRYVEGQRWQEALSAAQLALGIAPDEESRGIAAGYVRQISQNIEAQKENRNEGLYKILTAALVIGFIVGCNILVGALDSGNAPKSTTPISNSPNFNSSGNNPSPVVSPTSSRRSFSESLSRQRLDSQIDTNKKRLDALVSENEGLIAEYNSICRVNNCRLSDREFRRASQIEIRIDDISSEYDRLLRDTNTLIDRYNRTP